MEEFFETIKCEDEEVLNIHYHNQRVARTIGMNINLLEYIYPPNNKLLKCKVIYNKEEVLNVEFTPYKEKNIKSFKIIVDNTIEYKYKSANRKEIDKLYKEKEDCDEIIIIKNGLVTDTSIANILIYENGIWFTPKKPLLQGTTIDRLLLENHIKQSDITLKQLQQSNKIALTNAMIGFKVIENFTIKI
ncbi:MAG: branched-chain amino acid aminotransferase [Epsilonproteobacteria bacterium]|nr:MAG: branched-chain amino acid aminotransferase [Campylobacterota bacterium]